MPRPLLCPPDPQGLPEVDQQSSQRPLNWITMTQNKTIMIIYSEDIIK